MSLSNEQLRHVIGDENDQSSISIIAEDLRALVPVLQRSIGERAMDGIEFEEIQRMAGRANSALLASEVLDRLCDYLGSLES